MTYHSSVIILNHLSEMLGGSVHDYDYDYEISLFGHRRKKNEHKGIINNKMVETTIKNINISKHDTKLISVVRLVIVIKCAPEISLVQVF